MAVEMGTLLTPPSTELTMVENAVEVATAMTVELDPPASTTVEYRVSVATGVTLELPGLLLTWVV
jgi:hypothetical protein